MDFETANRLFTYDPETGIVIRKATGLKAGWVNGNGYLRVNVETKKVYIHHLAWVLATGVPAKALVDHRNGDKMDNRFANLRECTDTENHRNSKQRAHSRNPYKGVRPMKNSKNWCARIRVDNREVWLGSHATPELAHAAYCAAALRFHGEFARVS